MSVVYKHTNRNNGKAYIGWSSTTMEARWEAHLHCVMQGSDVIFHNAIRKHGAAAWEHEVLEIHEDDSDAKNAEIRLIADHKTFFYEHPDKGYNMTRGGDGITKGTKWSESMKQKWRVPRPGRQGEKHPLFGRPAWNRGKKTPQETLMKQSEAHKGPLSEAHKLAISLATKGERNPMYGRKRDPMWGKKGWETRRRNQAEREKK